MGKKISDKSSGGGFLPTAYLKDEGKMIKGVLLESRMVATQYGDKPVYKIKVLDASCKFVLDKNEVTPVEGSEAEFFAATRLDRQLKQVPFGSTVTIVHLGKKKFGKGGNAAHTYDVEVEG